MLSPKETGQFVMSMSQDVTIDVKAIEGCNLIVDSSIEVIHRKWHEFPGHPKANHRHLIDYVFLIDSLNFSFWSDDPCTIDGKRGYAGFISALSRHERIWDPMVYGFMSIEGVQELFKTDQGGCLPMYEQRWEIMTTNAKILMEKFDGTARKILELADYDAEKIVQLVVSNFPNFNDSSSYNGQPISFLKRAQILVADIYSAVGRVDYIHNIDKLTMFADYRVPQVLLSLNILKYSDDLLKTINARLLETGEAKEVEIRAASIQAVELLSKKLSKPAFAIDYALWDYAGENWTFVNSLPMHRIRSIFY